MPSAIHYLLTDSLWKTDRKVEFNIKTRKINVILNIHCEYMFDCIRLYILCWIHKGYVKHLTERAQIPD